MSNNNQTSVDYLFNDLIANPGNYIKAYQKAKAMHKEEISNAFSYFGDEYIDEKHCDEYYNETFGDN